MDTIKTYVDNIFAAFPASEKVDSIKREMMNNMEEKYTELRQNGKSEHEAAYGVIADFGSADEIVAELDLYSERFSNHESPKKAKEIFLTQDEAEEYTSALKTGGRNIALGVWIILTGVASLVFVSDSFESRHLGILILLGFVAVAVAMFITSAYKMEAFASYERKNIYFSDDVKAELEYQRGRCLTWFVQRLVFGIISILAAVGVIISLDGQAVPLFLFIVGFGVFWIVYSAVTFSAYEVLLGKGDYANKKANNDAGRLIGTVAAAYWPATVAVFLLWSFLLDDWGRSWIVWPVAGVLFGAIAGGIGAWFGSKNE